MRPLAACLLIACTLVFGQAAGIMHALSHLPRPAKSLPAGTGHAHHCLVCDAYDALGHGPARAPDLQLAPPLRDLPRSFPGYCFLSTPSSPLPIRAPPARVRLSVIWRAARKRRSAQPKAARDGRLVRFRGGTSRDSRSHELMRTEKWNPQNGFLQR
jgi:hypothetical protein